MADSIEASIRCIRNMADSEDILGRNFQFPDVCGFISMSRNMADSIKVYAVYKETWRIL